VVVCRVSRVLYLPWRPLRTMAVEQDGALACAYGKNIVFLTVIWFLCPLVFLIGPEGLKIIARTRHHA